MGHMGHSVYDERPLIASARPGRVPQSRIDTAPQKLSVPDKQLVTPSISELEGICTRAEAEELIDKRPVGIESCLLSRPPRDAKPGCEARRLSSDQNRYRYILGTTRIPSSSSPCCNTRAVVATSTSLDRVVCSSLAFNTGQLSLKTA